MAFSTVYRIEFVNMIDGDFISIRIRLLVSGLGCLWKSNSVLSHNHLKGTEINGVLIQVDDYVRAESG